MSSVAALHLSFLGPFFSKDMRTNGDEAMKELAIEICKQQKHLEFFYCGGFGPFTYCRDFSLVYKYSLQADNVPQ